VAASHLPGVVALLREVASRDDGQDLLEYAFLAAAVALASAATLGLLQETMGTAFASWHTATFDLEVTTPPLAAGEGS
jgi:hypothetical protein